MPEPMDDDNVTIAQLRHKLAESYASNMILVKQLMKDRKQFQNYQQLHMSKSPPDVEKAETNEKFAGEIELALKQASSIALLATGHKSLTELGLSYYADADNWEVTYEAADLDVLSDSFADSGGEIQRIKTFISGPELFAADVPTSDDGESEIRVFATEELASGAMAEAIAKFSDDTK